MSIAQPLLFFGALALCLSGALARSVVWNYYDLPYSYNLERFYTKGKLEGGNQAYAQPIQDDKSWKVVSQYKKNYIQNIEVKIENGILRIDAMAVETPYPVLGGAHTYFEEHQKYDFLIPLQVDEKTFKATFVRGRPYDTLTIQAALKPEEVRNRRIQVVNKTMD